MYTILAIAELVVVLTVRESLLAVGALSRRTLIDRISLGSVWILALLAVTSIGLDAFDGIQTAEIDLVAMAEDVEWPAPTGPLPPVSYEELVPILIPIVEPLGYHLSRAQLFGDHLAIYVAPIDDQSADEYAAAIVPLSTVFLPAIFDLWPDLASVDICQEHVWEGRYDEAPPVVTVIDLTRATASAFDWDTVELATLIEAARAGVNLRLGVDQAVAASAVWRAAGGGDDLIEVRLPTTSTATTWPDNSSTADRDSGPLNLDASTLHVGHHGFDAVLVDGLYSLGAQRQRHISLLRWHPVALLLNVGRPPAIRALVREGDLLAERRLFAGDHANVGHTKHPHLKGIQRTL